MLNFAAPKALLSAFTPRQLAEHYLRILRTRRRLISYHINGTAFMVRRGDAKRLVEEELRRACRDLVAEGRFELEWPIVVSSDNLKPRPATPLQAAQHILADEVMRNA